MKYIGIDPGVNTGVATWDSQRDSFEIISTQSIILAMNYVLTKHREEKIFLRIEDARLRKWFANKGREVLQGAGSVKRDCQIWEELCLAYNIPFEFVAPKNNKTKLNAQLFSKYTGYKNRTNQHGRDAAMLVYKFKKQQ